MTTEHKPHSRLSVEHQAMIDGLVEAQRKAFLADPSRYGGIEHAQTVYEPIVRSLLEQLETARRALEFYADPDTWNHVQSPDTGTAWEKVRGHPTPWVDAQHDLADVSTPASEPKS